MAGLWQCLKGVDVSALCNLLGRCGRAAWTSPSSSDIVCGYLQLTLIWHASLAIRCATRESIWNGFAQFACGTDFISCASFPVGRLLKSGARFLLPVVGWLPVGLPADRSAGAAARGWLVLWLRHESSSDLTVLLALSIEPVQQNQNGLLRAEENIWGKVK